MSFQKCSRKKNKKAERFRKKIIMNQTAPHILLLFSRINFLLIFAGLNILLPTQRLATSFH